MRVRWLVLALLFVAVDLGVYAWLHRDMDERLLRGADAVSSTFSGIGDLQEKIIFRR